MLTEAEKDALAQSFDLISPVAGPAAAVFFERLLAASPEYRDLFADDLNVAKQKLVRLVSFVVPGLTWRDDQWSADVPPESDVMLVLLGFGRKVGSGKWPSNFTHAARDALVQCLDVVLDAHLTPEARAAWQRAFDLCAHVVHLGPLCIDGEFAVRAAEAVLAPRERHSGPTGRWPELRPKEEAP